MIKTIQNNAKGIITDINNFLKSEAELITDFKTRVSNSIREIDKFQSEIHITYNRVINKMNEAECTQFLSEQSLFMEENY
jgi:hypothetical protein